MKLFVTKLRIKKYVKKYPNVTYNDKYILKLHKKLKKNRRIRFYQFLSTVFDIDVQSLKLFFELE